jgi:hypothetical protein
MSLTRSTPVRCLCRPVVGVGFLVLLAAGCQSKGHVTGKVTFKDKPLVYGTVLFVGSDGSSVQAMIQRDGNYSADGVAVGDAQVAVNSPNPKSIGIFTTWKNPAKKPPPLEIPGWFEIPTRYGDVTTSKLNLAVKGGSNTFDIELK